MLTSKQRAYLRGLGNPLDTILMVGKGGMSPEILKQADDAITAREIIKGKCLETSPLSSREAAEEIAAQIVMEQRIGILGGTFNPIHNAHLKMALDFSETLHFDKVLIIPTRIPPHKRAADMASTEDRLEMCRLAARSSPVFQVSDLEIRRPGPSYTSDTLEFLSGENPEARFYFLTGADMFLTIQDWRRPEKIFELATICAAPREKSDIFILQNHANRLKLQYGSLFQYEILDIPLMPVSSTEIRRRTRSGEPIDPFVPKQVADYIRERRLYQ